MTIPSPEGPVTIQALDEGQIWSVRLAAPKANVLDAKMVAALREVVAGAQGAEDLKALLIQGEGPSFSYGASVEEHRPDQVAGMLGSFHALFREMAATGVPVLAVVRGHCLGGGLELAAFAHRLFAAPDAKLGQPEIKLGVIAPLASVVLPVRIGRAAAEDLCLTGRTLGAEEALRLGLVDVVADDPEAAALQYVRTHLLPLSAASLRRAVRAARLDLDRRLHDDLDVVERLYLDDLMTTADAVEGIQAFLDKRPARWRNA